MTAEVFTCYIIVHTPAGAGRCTFYHDVGFQIINSADCDIILEPFYIHVRVYRADDVGGTAVYSYDLPVLTGTMPAHSFYLFSVPTWYGMTASGEMLPDGDYVRRTEMDDTFTFSIDNGRTLAARDVDFRYVTEQSFTINASWPKTINAYTGAEVYLNDELFEITDASYGEVLLIDDKIYLPLRALVEALDGEISWDNHERRVYVEQNNQNPTDIITAPGLIEDGSLSASTVIAYSSFLLFVNTSVFDVGNGEGYSLIINDRTYLPLCAISEALNIPIRWD